MGTPQRFATTHWSLILEARAGQREALGALCRNYWQPLYAFARRRGHDDHESEDLVQGFFAHILERSESLSAGPERGRFRSWLIAAFKNYISHEREKTGAQKRGGGQKLLHLDLHEAERQIATLNPKDSPERGFEQLWAQSLLDQARGRLREAHEKEGRTELHDRLEAGLSSPEPKGGHRAAAQELGLSEGALRVALHRFRKRFRDELRRVISETLVEGESVDEELCALLAALAPIEKNSESS